MIYILPNKLNTKYVVDYGDAKNIVPVVTHHRMSNYCDISLRIQNKCYLIGGLYDVEDVEEFTRVVEKTLVPFVQSFWDLIEKHEHNKICKMYDILASALSLRYLVDINMVVLMVSEKMKRPAKPDRGLSLVNFLKALTGDFKEAFVYPSPNVIQPTKLHKGDMVIKTTRSSVTISVTKSLPFSLGENHQIYVVRKN